ncbi:OprD family porin [Pseudomonas sp. NPDC089752]|uniref:OprD family porin n=1 Tax=Pseudomonas sp. NPDC089752 TaxID=3364472 RepID=UPI00382F904C
MTQLRLACMALTPLLCLDVRADQDNGLIDGATLNLALRNFYFNRDFRHGASNASGSNAFKTPDQRNGYAEEWAQGFMLNLSSGYTPGAVGFGVDAYTFLGIKLDSGGGRTGLRLMPIGADGNPQDHFSKSGASIKARVSRTTVSYGQLFPATPVFAVNTVRLFPSSATGWMLNSKELSNTTFDAGHFTAQAGVDSSNNDDALTLDYGLPISIDAITYAGGRYQLPSGGGLSLYASELKDTWHQYYAGINYAFSLGDGQSLSLDGHLYRTLDTGQQLASVINNTTWSTMLSYRISAHTVSIAYQRVDSDEPMDWVGFGTMGGSVSLSNAVQYATFTEPNERSVQLRYDLNAAALGVPGLTFMTRYVRGDGVSNRHSNNTYYTARYRYPEGAGVRHWERDIEVRYVVQSGAAKDLSIRLRQATHRSSTGYRYPDNDEVRIIIDYPLSIL